jgi:hypothetical protein
MDGVVAEGDSSDRKLYLLTYLALFMALGHHVDHVIRGNNVGWPVSDEINAFTFSLAIYPIIFLGLYLYRTKRVGPGFWVFLSAGGALFLSFIHFAPGAIEPPGEIIDVYDSRAVGLLAFVWLLLLIAVLIATSVYEASFWLRRRRHSQ